MNDSQIKILLIESSSERNSLLSQILNEKGYQIETIGKIEPAIKKILNQTYDLVICENEVDEYNGFDAFKMLKKYLRNSGIPFFLVLDTFEKEDMLIGLEIGIDNFIVSPINKFSVLYKIENQLSKRNKLDIFENSNFKDYYNSSSVAMFFISNNKIDSVNQAFCKLNSSYAKNMLGMTIENVFRITENKLNELNYRRFQNGITNECKLIHVSSHINSSFTFSINLYKGNNSNNNSIFAELIPTLFSKLIENHNRILQPKIAESKANISRLNENNISENVKLTEREHQVFKLSASGLPIKIIASKLKLSDRTVEKHRANIMAKANARNMIEAIVYIRNLEASKQTSEY